MHKFYFAILLLMRGVSGGTILFFYVIYFFFNTRRYVSRLCPEGKMSCIRKYQRNILDFATTVKLALWWGFFPVFRQFLLFANRVYQNTAKMRIQICPNPFLTFRGSDLTLAHIRLKFRILQLTSHRDF